MKTYLHQFIIYLDLPFLFQLYFMDNFIDDRPLLYFIQYLLYIIKFFYVQDLLFYMVLKIHAFKSNHQFNLISPY